MKIIFLLLYFCCNISGILANADKIDILETIVDDLYFKVNKLESVSNKQILMIDNKEDCPDGWEKKTFIDKHYLVLGSNDNVKHNINKQIKINDSGFKNIKIENQEENKHYEVTLCFKKKI